MCNTIPTLLCIVPNSDGSVRLCDTTVGIDLDYAIYIDNDFILLSYEEDGVMR